MVASPLVAFFSSHWLLWGVNNATFDQLEGEGASMLLEVLTDILGVVKGSLDSEQELIPVGRT